MRIDSRAIVRRPFLDLLEIVRLWTIIAYVDARLALLPLSRDRGWLFGRAGVVSPNPGPRTIAKACRLAELSRIAARYRLRRRSPCLCLALALRARLGADGISAWICYGARRRSGEALSIDAHAWLSLGSFRIDPYGSSSSFNEFNDRER